MTLLKSVLIPKSGDVKPQFKLPSNPRSAVTILLGENGTRKSLILREILDQAVADLHRKRTKGVGIADANRTSAIFSRPPKKVIAISAMTSDRFPSKPLPGEIGSNGIYSVVDYSYLGPRTANNLVSKNQSILEFALAVLKSPDGLKKNRQFISAIAKKAGIPSALKINFNIASSFRNFDGNATAENYFQSGRFTASRRPHRWLLDAAEEQELYKKIDDLIGALDETPAKLKGTKRYHFNVDLDNGMVDFDWPIPLIHLYWALTFGIIRVTGIELPSEDGEKNTSNFEPSAGQWTLFSTMSSLNLVAENDTLVLVEEPENTLHPTWQRDYIDDVMSAVAHVKNSHVIIATHSPLIAASLKYTRDHLVRLTKVDGRIEAKLVDAPAGWTPDDVLEEIFGLPTSRPKDISRLLETALDIIGKGDRQRFDDLREIKRKLEPYKEILPADDVARNIITAVINVIDNPDAKKIVRPK